MQVFGPIHSIYHQLIPEVGLNLYAVKGARRTAMLDSGIRAMLPQILSLLSDMHAGQPRLDYLLVTHAHVDHIGNNHALVERFNSTVIAHPIARPWLEDYNCHLREFCNFAPDVLPAPPVVVAGNRELMDEPVPLDLAVHEGCELDLGGGVHLTAFHLPGHKMEELGWFERSTRTLLLGDAVICTALPFLHGYMDVAALLATLDRLPSLVAQLEAERIVMAHYPPAEPKAFRERVESVRRHVLEIGEACLAAVRHQRSASLSALFSDVCRRLHREGEFHTLSAVMAHLDYLAQNKVIRKVDARHFETC